jgi:exopolyphosphatase/guanosine-5'-triphosphate,3'-diphosphate pyrophosphatase
MRAVVDIGSNSVKILVAKIQRGIVVPQWTLSRVTRLGKNLEKTGHLCDESIENTKKVLLEFSQELNRFPKIKKIEIIATEAVRRANNQNIIFDMVKSIFHQPLLVLSGNEEARYSFYGAKSEIKKIRKDLKQALLIDLGGASTEVGILKPKEKFYSFPIGAVRAFEMMKLSPSKITKKNWVSGNKKLETFLKNQKLNLFLKKLGKRKFAVVIGGTLLLAMKAMRAKKISSNMYFAKLEEVKRFCDLYKTMSLKKRIDCFHIEKGRADILPAGIAVIIKIIEDAKIDEIYVTTTGLRHGFLSANP